MEWTIVIYIAITSGIVEVVKRMELVDSKFMPLIALVVGLVIIIIGGGLLGVNELTEKILLGLIVGLSAVGLFEVGKQGIKKN